MFVLVIMAYQTTLWIANNEGAIRKYYESPYPAKKNMFFLVNRNVNIVMSKSF